MCLRSIRYERDPGADALGTSSSVSNATCSDRGQCRSAADGSLVDQTRAKKGLPVTACVFRHHGSASSAMGRSETPEGPVALLGPAGQQGDPHCLRSVLERPGRPSHNCLVFRNKRQALKASLRARFSNEAEARSEAFRPFPVPTLRRHGRGKLRENSLRARCLHEAEVCSTVRPGETFSRPLQLESGRKRLVDESGSTTCRMSQRSVFPVPDRTIRTKRNVQPHSAIPIP